MQVELGLVAPSCGARADVVLDVDPGTSLGAVRAELLARVLPDGAAGDDDVVVGGRPVPASAPLGRPPLLRGALLQVGRAQQAPAHADLGSRVELHCVGGPDAGGRWPLRAGAALVGRGPTALVRVDDPLISREHCTLIVDASPSDAGTGQVSVRDCGATNGTQVDGAPVGNAPVPLPPGAVLQVGASRFTLPASHGSAGSAGSAVPTRPDSAGMVAFNRPPRLRRPAADVCVHVPEPPRARERRPLPVLAVLAPLVLGVVLWRVLGSATFLLFTLLSPVLVVGAAVTDRRAGRRTERRERQQWRQAVQRAHEQLRAAVRADVQARRAAWPDPATTAGTASAPGQRLWERRRDDEDFLAVALGCADQPAGVRVTGEPEPDAALARVVPVVVPLQEVGVLGVAGRGGSARALARWVTAQAAVWHSPRDLSVVVLASLSRAPAWEWTRWLPHTRPVDGQACRTLLGFGEQQAAARVAELRAHVAASSLARAGGGRPARRVLVVVDGPTRRDVAGLAELLAEGPAAGVHAVVVERDARLLPESCGATAVVEQAEGTALELAVRGQPLLAGATADGVALRWADELARALAPFRDTSAEDRTEAALPPALSWSALVDLPLTGTAVDVEQVLERWASCGATTSARLGTAAGGPFSVDLCADGPHALVAGTTGSGKSELLQTWIASLVLGNRPDALQLVLVDYKGGAAFGACARLPHVVGVVTDLDGGLAARALAALAAELRRREALLATTGAKDLAEHRRRAGPDAGLARLVIVVDEFAFLAEELPDFVGGLVDIAMRGRSLGVHLVLATQRPGGVVSADIRANTGLRLCLAVARETDSHDVLDTAVAAHLSRTRPGRCYARTGHADLTLLQVARVAAPRPGPADRSPRVALLPALELGDPVQRSEPGPLEPPATGGAPSELDLLVEACAGAAARLDLPPVVPPWLPALPSAVALADLPVPDDPSAMVAGRTAQPVFGLVDLPEQQQRAPLRLDLDRATHLLVVGGPRSGRTTTLRTFAGALAAAASADDVHLYAIDATGSALGVLAELPHTGAVVTRGQDDRLERLLAWLVGELALRQSTFAAGGHASLAEQRAAAEPERQLPHLVLLLDGFDAFLADHQDRDAGRLVEAVHALLREGPAAGLHVVLTAGRSGLSGRLAASFDTRLVLRLSDRADHALAGVPERLVPRLPTAGRGWLLTGAAPHEVQVALLSPDATGAGQAAALSQLARSRTPAAASRRAHRFLPLPARVPLSDLPPDAPPSLGCAVLGAGGDEATSMTVDLRAGFLVAGPPGSGRSTTLCTLAGQLRAGGLPLVAVAPRPSPLRELSACLRGDEPVELLEQRLAGGRCALLVDDAELLLPSALAPILERAVREARDRGTVVVAAGTTDDLVLGYRGFVVDLRRSRAGLLLWPQGPADGDLLGVRLPRTPPPAVPPGRGLLCVRGRSEAVQVAC